MRVSVPVLMIDLAVANIYTAHTNRTYLAMLTATYLSAT
jgi:hypothetical protein